MHNRRGSFNNHLNIQPYNHQLVMRIVEPPRKVRDRVVLNYALTALMAGDGITGDVAVLSPEKESSGCSITGLIDLPGIAQGKNEPLLA